MSEAWATAPAADIFERLWSGGAQAASDALYLDHPGYVLIRRGQQVRATLLGDYLPESPLPAGVSVTFGRPGWLEVWCTREGLAALSLDARTVAIHPPLRLLPSITTTEALGSMAVAPLHAAGVGGAGVRLAIIDVDFTGHEALLGTDLPAHVVTRSFVDPTLQPYLDRSRHGTAVAEIIHDIAPEADLIFLSILDGSNFTEAVTWCIENDVDIVSMSLGFLAGPRDGTSVLSAEVDRAAEAGILWVNSAGNAGDSHWGGNWTDVDQDSYLDFAPGREVIGFTYQSNQSGSLTLFLTQLIWDRWPSTVGLSLDIEIYRDSLRTLLVTSSNGQPSVSLAYRLAALDNPLSGTRYFLAVKRQAGVITAPLRLDVFTDPNATVDMQPQDPFGSILIPADARGAIAAGAYDYGQAAPGTDPVRFYSSRGPTWDGRIKPEIVAADGVSTTTYGNHGFYGTSASAPHVAGAAALLSSAAVRGGLFTYIWNVDDLLRLFTVRSIDFGAPGVDSTYGLGGLVMPPASSRALDLAVTAFPNPFNAELVIAFRIDGAQSYTVDVFDLLGRRVWSTSGAASAAGDVRVVWPGRDAGGHDLGSGAYFFSIETSTGLSHRGRAVMLK